MLVVVTGVFGEHGGQVPLTDDEYPVGAAPGVRCPLGVRMSSLEVPAAES